jgi:hypothetical protein
MAQHQHRPKRVPFKAKVVVKTVMKNAWHGEGSLRLDANGDGMLTLAEIESRQKKMFALMDRNDDGKIVKDEMPSGRRGKGWN